MTFRRALTSGVAALALAFSAAVASASDDTPTNPAPAADTPVLKQATVTSFNPLLPPMVLGGLGGVCLLLCLYGMKRGVKGSAARAMAGAVLLYAAANHEKITSDYESLPTETLVVIDNSISQDLGDRKIAAEAAKATLERQLKEIPGVNVKIVTTNSNTAEKQQGTYVLDTIQSALADIPRERLGAVFVVTDGQLHDKIPADYSLGKNIPIHGLITGKDGEVDRRVILQEASRFGLVDKKQDIRFRVLDQGDDVKGQTPVKIIINHDGTPLQTKMAKTDEDITISVDIPHTGTNIFEIIAEPLNGETSTLNNRIVAQIEGIHEKLSVLILSGAPNQNTRMWRSLLKADPDVDPIHFMRQRYPEQLDDTPRDELALMPFPMNEIFGTNLEKFDLVIMDSYDNRHLLSSRYLENIAAYVKNGGALLITAGPEYAADGSLFNGPLGSILPAAPDSNIIEKPYKPFVNKMGLRHPVTRDIPGRNETPDTKKSSPTWESWQRQIGVKDIRGDVLMEGAGEKPLLILSKQEKGRVALLLSDSVWRWERGLTGGPYNNLLLNISHWLMKNPALEEEALTIRHDQPEIVITQQTMDDKSTPVTVQTPSGKTINVKMEPVRDGLWQARIPADEKGLYKAEQKGRNPRVSFTNAGVDNQREFINTASTKTIMQPLSQRTGGLTQRIVMDQNGKITLPPLKPLEPSQDQRVASTGEMGIKMTNAKITRSVEKNPVVPYPLLALAFFAAMGFSYWQQSERRLMGKNQPSKTPSPSGPTI